MAAVQSGTMTGHRECDIEELRATFLDEGLDAAVTLSDVSLRICRDRLQLLAWRVELLVLSWGGGDLFILDLVFYIHEDKTGFRF